MLPPIAPRSGDPVRADFFQRLIEWIKSDVIPRGDNATTMVHGNVITAFSSEDSTSYNGWFKVSKTNSGLLSVKAGYAYFNLKAVSCAAVSGITPETGYFCLGIEETSTDDEFSVSYTIEESIPNQPIASGTSKYPLAYIEVTENSDGSDTVKITQLCKDVMPHLFLWGTCDDSSSTSGSSIDE